MSIIQRLRRLAEANINRLLDKADDPEEALNDKIRELEQNLTEAREAVARFAVTLKRAEHELEELARARTDWQNKAEQALKDGNEDVARRALGEKLKVETRLGAREPAAAKSRETYAGLKDNLVLLRDQLEAARLKLAELQSRRNAARAEKTFGARIDRMAAGARDAGFSRLEEQVLQSEAEAEVDRELRAETQPLDARIEQKLAQSRVDAELEELKKKLGA